MDINKAISNIRKNKLTNNTQRVAYKLLSAKGKWLSRVQISGTSKSRIPSVAARIRDLRKTQFGKFRVECRSASRLGKRASHRGQFYYRIEPNTVTTKQVTKVFKLS